MGSAIVDGFERGFNMMERHNARVGRNQRLANLDKRNEEHYQQGQDRLASIDAQNNERYKDTLAYREQTAKNTNDYRRFMQDQSKARTDNQVAQNKWQQKEQLQAKQWSLIQPQLENIHAQFYKTGKLPEEAKSFFGENPVFNDYNPLTYTDKNRRDSIKQLKTETHQALETGDLKVFQKPEFLKLFNDSFQSTIKRGVGEMDMVRNAKVIDKQAAEFIPVGKDEISIGLKVTYQKTDGSTYEEVQPMTKGGTGEQDDPVNKWKLNEMLSAIEVRGIMADLAENGDQYQERSNKVLGAVSAGGNKQQKPQWKEVKGDMGQTLGYQNLNNGSFQKLNNSAEVAGMSSDEKLQNDKNLANEHTNQFISGANEVNNSMGLGLNSDDIKVVVEEFKTALNTSGSSVDANKLLADMMQKRAMFKVERAKQKKYNKDNSTKNITTRQTLGNF